MIRFAGTDSVPTGTPLPPGYTLPGGVGCNAGAPYQASAAAGQRVLTVGASGQFQTIAAAVAASANGDLILVQPGTYTNDFAEITDRVTIAGAGGMVNIVAAASPANEKGIFVTDNNVEIDNVVFQGASVPDSVGGNGAGIRYQGGALVLHNDAFIDNQNGIMGAAVDGLPVNTITIQGSTFDHNGNATGPDAGYTHNVYAGSGITSFTASGSVFEQANVGHELKSRALTNVITGNVFYDGPTGTASYGIDLPNGGADTVSGNIIEKGPLAQNNAMVHFGGEGIPYAGSKLTITGNRFVNDRGASAIGLLNQTTLKASITGNEFDNFAAATIGIGLFDQSGNVDQNGAAIAASTSLLFAPGTDLDDFSQDANPHSVTLTGGAGVLGGGGLLNVTVHAGHVTVVGGSGGLNYQEGAGFGGSYISTAAGAADTVFAAGQDTVSSAGTDSITGGAGNLAVEVDGVATIASGTGSNAYVINGQASVVGGGGGDTVQANATGASVAITGREAYLQVTVSGGTAAWTVIQGGATLQATINGGASATEIYGGGMNITTSGAGAGSAITFGAGRVGLVSAGADTIHAGSGTATILVSGSSQIFAGSGALSVFGHSEAGQASVYGGSGAVTLNGDTGNITYFGGSTANAVSDMLSNTTIQGGDGLMKAVGGSRQTIFGGSGGLVFTTAGGADIIATRTGAHDTVSFTEACTLVSNGTDVIGAGTGNSTITANGNATITGSTGNAAYILNGADSLSANGGSHVTVGAGAQATVAAYGGITDVAVSASGTLSFSQRGNADHEAVTVTGAGASLDSAAAANITTIALNGGGDGVVLGAGHDSVSANALGTRIWTGSGPDTVAVWQGGGQIHAGAGTLTVSLNDWADQAVTSVFGGGGAISLVGGYGNLAFFGGRGAATLGGTSGAEAVAAGAGNITLQGGNAGTLFNAGTGNAVVNLTPAGATVNFSHGNTNVTEAAWGHADLFTFTAGHGGGNDSITGFRPGTDTLVFSGVSVASTAMLGGSTLLTLTDGTHLSLIGVSAGAVMGLHLPTRA